MADEEQEGRKAAISMVKSIMVYPIKSCRGISVSQAPITSTGFRWDRQWLVVNSKGRAYTQRVEPKLALVEVVLPNEAFSKDWQANSNSYLVAVWAMEIFSAVFSILFGGHLAVSKIKN